MQITVSKPEFDDLFKSKVARAKSKGAYIEVSSDDKNISITVKNNILYNGISRILGVFIFEIDGDTCTLVKKHTIERSYCPFELTIFSLTKYLKRKKVKYVVWD